MRGKRLKKFQRSINFFKKNFGFEEPYHILIDGTFANCALANKINMREQFPKYFDGTCKLLTTPCAMIETEQLGPALYGALQILKGLHLQKCQHSTKPVQASDCLKSIAGRSKKSKTPAEELASRNFVVATQDAKLRQDFRQVLGVPLLYLHGNAPVLEKPSDFNTAWAEKRDKKKLNMSAYQKEILNHIKDDLLPKTEGPVRKGTRKRKRAGPNPLSCKKPKKQRLECKGSEIPSPSSVDSVKKKRKRIKIRVPKHVKELTSS